MKRPKTMADKMLRELRTTNELLVDMDWHIRQMNCNVTRGLKLNAEFLLLLNKLTNQNQIINKEWADKKAQEIRMIQD